MKIRQIAIAAAACCAGLASLPSFAITANNYTNTGEFTGDTVNIRISGASAQDAGILGTALSLCQAGTVHRYAISNNVAFFCMPDVGTNPGQLNVPAGKTKLAIYKYSVGGSYFGVGPVNSNTATDGSSLTTSGNQLPFLDLSKITTANLVGATTSTVTFNTTLGSYVNVALNIGTNASNTAGSGAVTTAATTYIGVSDVEPAFFTNSAANLTSTNVYALIFGVPVSLNLRDALQTQQIAAGTLAAGCVGLETEACMPSLSSAQLQSAYTQGGQTWAGIGVSFAGPIYVARRVNSSGTQKTFEALIAKTVNGQGGLKNCVVQDAAQTPFAFLGGSLGNDDTAAGDPASACSSAPQPVFSGSGGGDVRACLIAHNAAGRGAIGMLTTEDKATTGSAAGNWRFVKVNGVTPNQVQTAAGNYPYWVESFLHSRTGGAFATTAALGYTSALFSLNRDLINPTLIAQINGADHSFGKAGLMGLYSKQGLIPPAGLAFTGAQPPVLPWTKADGGGVTNNCVAPTVNF